MEAHIVKGREPISEEEMYEMYKINKDFRETERVVHNNRTTTLRRKDGEVAQALNHQTKLFVVPKYGTMIPEWSVEIMKELLGGKEFETRKAKEQKETGNLGGLVLSDLHLNSRDIKNNTFEKRVKIVNDRINRVMDRLLRFDPEKLIVPNLGDMNNSEVKHLTSSLKVPMQDTMSMEDAYKRLLVREISMLESMKQYGLPLKYVKLGGNHDSFSSHTSTIALQYYFKNSDIEIDTAKHRYYEIRGNTMIALSHGDRGEGKKLFQMVVDECISKTRKKLDYMYAILGHHHRTIVNQEGPLEITNVQGPLEKTEFCDKYGMDMKQSMSGFIRGRSGGKVCEVRG